MRNVNGDKGVSKMAEKNNIVSNRYYTITAKLSGKAMEVENFSQEDGGLIQLWESNGVESQQWKIVQMSGNDYKIVCKNSGKVLDTVTAGTENGTWVHQWENLDVESQLWNFEKNEDGSYKILSKLCGKCLDVAELSAENGARVQIWDDLNGENQKWEIKPIENKSKSVSVTKTKPTKKSGIAAPMDELPAQEITEPKASKEDAAEVIPQAAPAKRGRKKKVQPSTVK
jgi:hypothetical protein